MYKEPYRLQLEALINKTDEVETMGTKRIIKLLNALGREAEEKLDSLNSGGCAVFAAHVGYQLKYRLGLTDVVLRAGNNFADNSDDLTSIDEARNNVRANANAREWNSAGIHFGHVILQFATGKRKHVYHHYDSSGVTGVSNVTNNFGFVLHPGEMSVEEGLAIASVQDGWNHCFDRAQIPQLIEIINRHFNKFAAA